MSAFFRRAQRQAAADDGSNSPFIVAVTGHRDLQAGAEPQLRGAVTEFLHQLGRQLPNTGLRVMVGMAEGADLLIAQIALELGLPVDAVLPMPFEQYATDFSAESLELLRRLLQKPGVHVVELPTDHGSRAGPGEHAINRDEAYATLTRHLIRSSGLLLALWDGKPSPLPGGTADTVLRYLGVRTEDSARNNELEFLEAGTAGDPVAPVVYWVPVERSGGGPVTGDGGPCYLWGVGDHVLQMHAAMPQLLQHQLAGLDEYNSDFQRLAAGGSLGKCDSLLATLPADASMHKLPVLRAIDAQYGKADSLAVYYQKRSDRLFGFFGWMTFAMSLTYLSYHKLSESRLLLYAYLLVLLVGLAVHYLLVGRRWFAKHLLCRALAETLRARFYLHLADVDDRVNAEDVITMSGIDRFHGFGWFGLVLKSAEAPRPAPLQVGVSTALAAGYVDRAWIKAQQSYFSSKVTRLERSSRRIAALRQLLFAVILLVTLTLIFFGESLHNMGIGFGDVKLKYVLEFLMGFVAVLFGVWELHQHKMASRELLWQYRNQLLHFSRATSELARTTAPDRRRDILAALGRDSLMESYLWTIHRYHREHEPPASA